MIHKFSEIIGERMKEFSLTIVNNEKFTHDILCITQWVCTRGELMCHNGGLEWYGHTPIVMVVKYHPV